MATIEGDDGPNTLIGTAESDRIVGFGGDDFIDGRQGDDGGGLNGLQGRDGDDTILSGSGNDVL
jgi:Ca2+-binding RTX toxin-like protein